MNWIELEKTTISVSDLANLARNGTVILTQKGKPLVAVKDLSQRDWESISLANNPRFLALIEASRESYRREGGIPLANIRQELGFPAKSPRSPATKRKKVPRKRS
jgi:hypothetical protein